MERLKEALEAVIGELETQAIQEPAAEGTMLYREDLSTEKWRGLIAQMLRTAKRFEIHCWQEEKTEIALACKYGAEKQTNWAHGTVICGEVTPEFTWMILHEKGEDDEAFIKFTPFFNVFLDDDFQSSHYGTEVWQAKNLLE